MHTSDWDERSQTRCHHCGVCRCVTQLVITGVRWFWRPHRDHVSWSYRSSGSLITFTVLQTRAVFVDCVRCWLLTGDFVRRTHDSGTPAAVSGSGVFICIYTLCLASRATGRKEVLSPRAKRPGRISDHSPSSTVEIKNAWIHTSTQTYIYLHGLVFN